MEACPYSLFAFIRRCMLLFSLNLYMYSKSNNSLHCGFSTFRSVPGMSTILISVVVSTIAYS